MITEGIVALIWATVATYFFTKKVWGYLMHQSLFLI